MVLKADLGVFIEEVLNRPRNFHPGPLELSRGWRRLASPQNSPCCLGQRRPSSPLRRCPPARERDRAAGTLGADAQGSSPARAQQPPGPREERPPRGCLSLPPSPERTGRERRALPQRPHGRRASAQLALTERCSHQHGAGGRRRPHPSRGLRCACRAARGSRPGWGAVVTSQGRRRPRS